jgi:hypothetical protein
MTVVRWTKPLPLDAGGTHTFPPEMAAAD